MENYDIPGIPKDMMNNIIGNVTQLTNQAFLFYYLIALFILISLFIGYYISSELLKNTRNNSSMTKNLDNYEISISSINTNNAKNKFKLRDYYIMSSYNSCCNGDYSNTFVSIEALKNVIKRGARVLDFEIYSVNGKTSVSCSYEKSFYRKSSYNSLSFPLVMETIQRNAFASSTSPNFNDPLILHFRVKSQREQVFNDMTKSIIQIFGRRLLGSKYANEFNNENLTNEPLQDFLGKIIIAYDASNPLYKETKFSEIVNITSSSIFLRKSRDHDIRFAPNHRDLINFNKKNMHITMSDLKKSSSNLDPSIHIKYGCQMIAMNFQKFDSHLQYYLNFFNKSNTAFVLKPEPLRYIPVVVDNPEPQDSKLSYAPKQIKKSYFNAKV